MKFGVLALVGASMALSAGNDTANVNKSDLASIQGTWQLISAEKDGKKTPADVVSKIKVVIKGSSHSVYFGDMVVAKEIPFIIDAAKKPKTTEDRLPDGKVIRGIYELNGDTLKSCVASADKERPTKFAAKPGSGHTLRLFKRVKP